jgi:hypothetical protein
LVAANRKVIPALRLVDSILRGSFLGVFVCSIAVFGNGALQPWTALAQGRTGGSNLPPARYQELRRQALGQARMIAGPRLKNPGLGFSGLGRGTSAGLAEQRAYHTHRLGIAAASLGGTSLLSDQTSTLLPPDHAGVGPPLQQVQAGLNRQIPPRSCGSPVVRSVNGRSTLPVFTPAEPDNQYHIEGCGFGSNAGTVYLQPTSMNLMGGSGPRSIPLQLDAPGSWNDDHIDVHVNPHLTGLPDFGAELVIQLANGRQVQLPGCLFIAVRGEPQILRTIPAAWVRLDTTSTSAHVIRQFEFESPPVPSDEVPPEATGSSAFIARSDPEVFSAGKDVYDLSRLAPGWVVESVQLEVFDPSCPGDNKPAVSTGSWATSWTAHGFVVAWAGETCRSAIPPVFTFAISSSQYATRVWVIGPAGTEPLPNAFSAMER